MNLYLVLLTCLAPSGSARASMDPLIVGCRTEIRDYCAVESENGGRAAIVNCLGGISNQLSEGCRTAVEDYAKKAKPAPTR